MRIIDADAVCERCRKSRYLVYAPGYWGNSKIYGLDGLAYSNFKHNYKVHWGIERGTGRGWPGVVTHWMPMPAPPDRRPPEGEA